MLCVAVLESLFVLFPKCKDSLDFNILHENLMVNHTIMFSTFSLLTVSLRSLCCFAIQEYRSSFGVGDHGRSNDVLEL